MDNHKVQVVTVVGARPQFVKAAVLSAAFQKAGTCTERLLHTGQHYDTEMSESFFSALGIPAPTWNLGVGSASHGVQTGRMLIGIEEILLREKPELVVVYGDTNSTLAAAIAAVKLNIPVAHVEAGIRSNNFAVPEELNRRMTDHVSSLLFAPTATGVAHLRKEGIAESKIHWVGDVMYDLSLKAAEAAEKTSDILDRLGLVSKQFVLATIHRAENTDVPKRMESILQLLSRVSQETRVVFPVHPRSKKFVEEFCAQQGARKNLLITSPASYFDMVKLERHACAIITDSGGVQKEAFFHKVPCVTLKDETEWPETVESGCNLLTPPGNADAMFENYRLATTRTLRFDGDFYGDGDAGGKIVTTIEKYFRP